MINLTRDKESRTFNNRFYIKKRISAGSFGVVFLCSDSATQEFVALKIEKDEGDNMMSLDRESQILDAVKGVQGVPKLLWHGREHGYECMAIQLLGRDLCYHLRNQRKFSLKCVINIADQLIHILENIHRKNVIHRDIKPENILTGRETDQNTLYLVDYGISKFYREADGSHIPSRDGKPFIGTTRYASIAAHKGYELSRRDDLESLGYVLVYLCKGILPWQNIQTNNDKDKTKLVGQMKMQIEVSDLCKDLPIEFVRYFDYCKKLNFKQQPDYKYLQLLFHKMAQSNGVVIDRKFDWFEGTTTTKSGDTSRKNSRALDQQSNKVKEKRALHSKKSSINDLSASSMFSQGDFLLKPPKRNRMEQRHKSMQEGEGEGNSDQSSVQLNYMNSQYNNQSNSNILHSLRKKNSFLSNHLRGTSNMSQMIAFQAMDSNMSSELKSRSDVEKPPANTQNPHNDVFNQQENFQDLEDLDEILNKNTNQERRETKKQIIVKEIKPPGSSRLVPEPTATTGNFEDLIDDDPQVFFKISQLQIATKQFQTLNDRNFKKMLENK